MLKTLASAPPLPSLPVNPSRHRFNSPTAQRGSETDNFTDFPRICTSREMRGSLGLLLLNQKWAVIPSRRHGLRLVYFCEPRVQPATFSFVASFPLPFPFLPNKRGIRRSRISNDSTLFHSTAFPDSSSGTFLRGHFSL